MESTSKPSGNQQKKVQNLLCISHKPCPVSDLRYCLRALADLETGRVQLASIQEIVGKIGAASPGR